MATPLYRKTPAGVVEIRERRAGLDARTRTLLILCNGRLGEAELSAQLNHPAAGLLQMLCSLGLLEPVATAARASLPAKAAAPAAPSVPERAAAPGLKAAFSAFSSSFGASRFDPGSTLSPDLPLTAEEHAAMIRRAWQVLEPLFGSGTGERIEPLDRAVETSEVRRALADIHAALAIYRGRKNATELIQRIERG